MGILTMIFVGLVAGLLARAIMPGNNAMGWLATIALGVVGSFVGGFLFSALWGDNTGTVADFHPTGIIGSLCGALIVLGIAHLVRRRTA
jgi:uncharacterized membrane protein YeaQ/YmgE (transglycosylase-associated protein family)